MNYTNPEYQTVKRTLQYSLTLTTQHQVGYRVRYKIDGVAGEEFIYFSSKNRHEAASLAVMKIHTSARIQEVKYA